MAALASEERQPERLDPRARADARDRQRRVRLAQRRVPAHARVRARDPARRARDGRDDRRRVPVGRAGARADVAGRAAGPRSTTSRRPRATSRELTDQSIELLPQTDLASKCARDVILLPTGNVVIRDEFQTGRENYKDFFYAMVGLAGEGQNFDGNGMYVRFQTGGGAQQVSLGHGRRRQPAAVRRAADAAARQPARATRARKPPFDDEQALLQAEAAGPQRPGRRARPRRSTPGALDDRGAHAGQLRCRTSRSTGRDAG